MMSQMYSENSLGRGSGHPTPNTTPLGLSWEVPTFHYQKHSPHLRCPADTRSSQLGVPGPQRPKRWSSWPLDSSLEWTPECSFHQSCQTRCEPACVPLLQTRPGTAREVDLSGYQVQPNCSIWISNFTMWVLLPPDTMFSEPHSVPHTQKPLSGETIFFPQKLIIQGHSGKEGLEV